MPTPPAATTSSAAAAANGNLDYPSDSACPSAIPDPDLPSQSHPEELDLDPGDTYQVDSSVYDSESDAESLAEEEYEALVQEADAGYTEEEIVELVAQLRELGLINFLREYNASGRSFRKLLLGLGVVPPRPLRDPSLPNAALLTFTNAVLSRLLRRRAKLEQYNTVDDAVELLRNAKNVLVLSGAGISTSCGIPDFRSATGLYAQLQESGRYELDDPQQMFDITYFREHPEVFYSFAKQIYPSNFVPSPCHRWIKLLEDRGVLLRNYTQNIDTLESLAGVQNVLQCHGSFKTASCLRCKRKMPGTAIEANIMEQRIPYCQPCRGERDAEIARIKGFRAQLKKGKGKSRAWEGDDDSDDDEIDEWGSGEPGIIKPDITFFGQPLDQEFDTSLYRDREKVDLLVIMGTSLKVAPVSEVLTHIPHSVPQIFINLTPVTHVRPDINLIGDADSIVTYLSQRLGWDIPPPPNGTPKPLAISPDDAMWISGEGEWSNLHMLRSRSEREAMALSGQTVKLTVAAPDSDSESDVSSGDESGDEAIGVIEADKLEVEPVAGVDVVVGVEPALAESVAASIVTVPVLETSVSAPVPIVSAPADSVSSLLSVDAIRPSQSRRGSSPTSDRPAKRSRVGSPVSDNDASETRAHKADTGTAPITEHAAADP